MGTYLESETEVKNCKLTKDRIVVLTAGIVRAEIIEERRARQLVGAEMKIDIEVVKEIARINNGKVRAVVREI